MLVTGIYCAVLAKAALVLIEDRKPRGCFRTVSLGYGEADPSVLMFINLRVAQAEHFDICSQSGKIGLCLRDGKPSSLIHFASVLRNY